MTKDIKISLKRHGHYENALFPLLIAWFKLVAIEVIKRLFFFNIKENVIRQIIIT